MNMYIHVHDCSTVLYCAGDATEMGQRQQVMALCTVMVLQFQIYNQADAKLTKLVWDLHKKVHVLVHVYIVWLYTLYGCIHCMVVSIVIATTQVVNHT